MVGLGGLNLELFPSEHREKIIFPYHPTYPFLVDPCSFSQKVVAQFPVSVAGKIQTNLLDFLPQGQVFFFLEARSFFELVVISASGHLHVPASF